MSKLIFDDIKTTEVLDIRQPLAVLKPKTQYRSPFSEFGDIQPSEEDGYHLGDCPNLCSNAYGIDSDYIGLVLFSIVVPTNENTPFIVFFIVKDSDEKWVFPVTKMNRDANSTLSSDILSLFHSSYRRLGFFNGSDNGSSYAVYEVDSVTNSTGELCGNSLSCGIWVTANEILEKSVLGCDICSSVIRFISHTGEGMSRLYKNGEFIPGPRVYYTRSDFKRNTTDEGLIILGDLAYAIIQGFFETNSEDGSVVPNIVLNTTDTSGSVTRFAVWDENCKSESYDLESTVTGERCMCCVVKVNLTRCSVMSWHLGSLTTDKLDAAEVLHRKMFIFE